MSDFGLPTAAPASNGEALALAAPPAEVNPCWSETGVYGNRSCPRLQEFVHCRDCPLYSEAGLQLLNRPLPQEYRRGWAEHFARKKKLAAPGNTSAVLFRLSAEWFALPTLAFQEVAEQRQIHSLPHRRRSPVLGLVNIRGELLVCLSLGHLLGVPQVVPPKPLRAAHHRLLVINQHGNRFVFPVDEVHGTHRFHPRDLQPLPATVTKSHATFAQGILYWRQHSVDVLNAELLFSAVNRNLA